MRHCSKRSRRPWFVPSSRRRSPAAHVCARSNSCSQRIDARLEARRTFCAAPCPMTPAPWVCPRRVIHPFELLLAVVMRSTRERSYLNFVVIMSYLTRISASGTGARCRTTRDAVCLATRSSTPTQRTRHLRIASLANNRRRSGDVHDAGKRRRQVHKRARPDGFEHRSAAFAKAMHLII